MGEITYTLQQLSDLEHIRTLKHRYFRAIDTADTELLETLFTEDVTVDYRGGSYRVSISGKAQMIDFLANAFHSGVLAMHCGHMPEIELESADTASGIWYLEDRFVDVETNRQTYGTAIYKDRYRRVDGFWKIAHTEYDRITEVVSDLSTDSEVTVHYLANIGRKPEQRTDISHLIKWD